MDSWAFGSGLAHKDSTKSLAASARSLMSSSSQGGERGAAEGGAEGAAAGPAAAGASDMQARPLPPASTVTAAGSSDDDLMLEEVDVEGMGLSTRDDSNISPSTASNSGQSNNSPVQAASPSGSPPVVKLTPLPINTYNTATATAVSSPPPPPPPAAAPASAPPRPRPPMMARRSARGFQHMSNRSLGAANTSTHSARSSNSRNNNSSSGSLGGFFQRQQNTAKAMLLANRLNWRAGQNSRSRESATSDLDHHGFSSAFPGSNMGGASGVAGSVGMAHHHRRYNAGELVLVHIHNHHHLHLGSHGDHHHHHHRVATPVNRFGFPSGEGETTDEQRGPYHYVLAEVKQVHFEEIALYYTVTRRDTGLDQRADTAHMIPIAPGTRGELAALRAAAKAQQRHASGYYGADGLEGSEHSSTRRMMGGSRRGGRARGVAAGCVEGSCLVCLLPWLWLYDMLVYVTLQWIAPAARAALRFLQLRAYLVLNGREPFVCRLRITFVNLMVLCSLWYMFMDQLRLAFFPASSDHALAAVSMAVWIILVLELVLEVFIRPDGYRELIISDKAYAPTTVRFINAFHVCVESISLLFYIPEFYCIWTSESCSTRYPFSFHNAVLISVIGPSRLEAFYGHLYLAMIRLRVFGLVRHWRNMWITNTFITMKYRTKRGGFFSLFIPSLGSRNSHYVRRSTLMNSNSNHNHHHSTKTGSMNMSSSDAEAITREEKIKELTLTNASNIGTALMVTNSYRAMVILWTILGLFPLILTLSSTTTNSSMQQLTEQLQAINMVATDTKNETCTYLQDSVLAWVKAVTHANYEDDDFSETSDPFLQTLVLEPSRCGFGEQEYANNFLCSSNVNMTDEMTSDWEEVCQEWLRNNRSSSSVVDGDDDDSQDDNGWNKRTSRRRRLEEDDDAAAEGVAQAQGSRLGSIVSFHESDTSMFFNMTNDKYEFEKTDFEVLARFDFTDMIRHASRASALLQFCILFAVLGGLSVLRRDAELLVLGPLRRMLRIVARYAKNPLIPPSMDRRADKTNKRKLSKSSVNSHHHHLRRDDSSLSDHSQDGGADHDAALGSYETETLITAVARITDLLRKCWGVAGADIISTNLATREGALTEVFNPTVPGKSVYALFAFAAINGFDHALRNLGGDVMVLINDVANVLHGEVFRWGFGDSGQCNKNLGGAFLMVFRIGLVEEVIEKLEQATDVIFSTKSSQTSTRRRGRANNPHSSTHTTATSGTPGTSSGSSHQRSSSSLSYHGGRSSNSTNKRRNQDRRDSSVKAMSLSLQSLPGISTFTDRAVIGMLKSFAGIYRDQKILKWNNDFRLGAGVGAFRASLIFGMDAGWAVEGAVGSEYKIDATYLSPHVNMASRMMSACKQYGVSIMLSQAVQELMSDSACSKLRHLDTVTVKGSSIKQRIYTYDCKAKGVDFFLYGRSDDQADIDAERYSPSIWNTDQDLKSMRQHVTDDFLKQFRDGHKAYLSGDWPTAIKMLEKANNTMFETAVEEGYLEDEFDALQIYAGQDFTKAADDLKRENGDGPSIYLINYMKSCGGTAPERWEGWHPLNRK